MIFPPRYVHPDSVLEEVRQVFSSVPDVKVRERLVELCKARCTSDPVGYAKKMLAHMPTQRQVRNRVALERQRLEVFNASAKRDLAAALPYHLGRFSPQIDLHALLEAAGTCEKCLCGSFECQQVLPMAKLKAIAEKDELVAAIVKARVGSVEGWTKDVAPKLASKPDKCHCPILDLMSPTGHRADCPEKKR